MLNFNWLQNVSAEQAKIIFLILFGIIAVLVLSISNEYIFEGIAKEDRRWYMNLKIWALLVLGSLFYTYYIF
ncbi:MAG: hypothetical protein KDC53_09905 [Saprospiraceae bacterium]|nr:hypothetical protein [Saprospiraceae bacterium]